LLPLFLSVIYITVFQRSTFCPELPALRVIPVFKKSSYDFDVTGLGLEKLRLAAAHITNCLGRLVGNTS